MPEAWLLLPLVPPGLVGLLVLAVRVPELLLLGQDLVLPSLLQQRGSRACPWQSLTGLDCPAQRPAAGWGLLEKPGHADQEQVGLGVKHWAHAVLDGC